MVEPIFDYETQVAHPSGERYAVRAMGQPQSDGTWIGWLEFASVTEPERMLRTDRETSQPSRDAVAYWASGLEPIFLEGAFARAH